MFLSIPSISLWSKIHNTSGDMFLVGLTGGIASGKTTVAEIFKENGIPVIDADAIARQIVEPGKKAWKQLRDTFGTEIFLEDGTLNRLALGDLISENVDARRKLNQITHPIIYKEMMWAIVKEFFKGHQFIVLDLPLLFETGYMLYYIYKVIVVFCDEEVQLQRLMDRNTLPEVKARRRINMQMPIEAKCEKADFVVDNTTYKFVTREHVLKIIETLRASKHHLRIRFILGFGFFLFVSVLYSMWWLLL